MHIEVTEMLRCPAGHREELLVLSTGEMSGRMVRSGVVGCPVCQREYEIVDGVVYFGDKERVSGERGRAAPLRSSRASLGEYAQTVQALLDLTGGGGLVVLLGSAARGAVSLAGLISGVHFVGVNAPADVEELPVLSLVVCVDQIPLRSAFARGMLVGRETATRSWLAEAERVLLRGRRLVVEHENPEAPAGTRPLASGHGFWVGEKK